MTARRLADGLAIVGCLGLVASTFAHWNGVEFAYFNRSTGPPAVAGGAIFSISGWADRPGIALALTIGAVLIAGGTVLAASTSRKPLELQIRGIVVILAVIALGYALAELGTRNGSEGAAFAALAATVVLAGGALWRLPARADGVVLGSAGALLLGATFARGWFGVPVGGWTFAVPDGADLRDYLPAKSAWQVFTWIDALLAVIAATLIAVAVRRSSSRVLLGVVAASASLALGLVLWRLVDPPPNGFLVAPALGIGLALVALATALAISVRRSLEAPS